MQKSFISIEVEDGEIEKIMDRLEKAQEEIRDCYDELRELGVLKIRKEKTATD